MCSPTSDHGEIIAWALRHYATPAEIIPRRFDSEPAILHFLFGKESGGTPEIRPIDWEDFFAKFDLLGLRMIFDDSPTFELLLPFKPSLHHPAGEPTT